MDKKTLVTFATKHGATAEIAARIGDVLHEAGVAADVLPVTLVNDPAAYEAVILGSAVYVGKWRKEAVRFLEQHAATLADRPVWLFSTGPSGEGDPVALLQGWRFPPAQQAIADRIRPRDITVFHGAVDPDRLGRIEKLMIKTVKAPVGDFRDWEAITAWAQTIAGELQAAEGLPA